MTAREYEIFSYIKANPDKTDVSIVRHFKTMPQSAVHNILDSLAEKKLIDKSDWPTYSARHWQDIDFTKQVDNALRFVTIKESSGGGWSTDASDLLKEFNNELTLSDVNAVCQYLINHGIVADASSKDGVSIGCTPSTHLAYKQKDIFSPQPDVQYIDNSSQYHQENHNVVYGAVIQNSEGIKIEQSTGEKGEPLFSKMFWLILIPSLITIGGILFAYYFGIG